MLRPTNLTVQNMYVNDTQVFTKVEQNDAAAAGGDDDDGDNNNNNNNNN